MIQRFTKYHFHKVLVNGVRVICEKKERGKQRKKKKMIVSNSKREQIIIKLL